MARYIMGIDEGTTFTRAVIFDHNAKIVSSAATEIPCYFPQPGWVEQDPQEILALTIKVASEAIKNSRISVDDIEGIGISNQLLTTIFWNKHTGDPIGRAIVWQDNRTLPICEMLRAKDQAGIEFRSGSHIFPNSAATKIRWLMEHDRTIQKGLVKGELLFGTVDTWLIWKLSGGAAHVTDLSNACLSLLLNSQSLVYDDWMLNELGIPRDILPELRSSSEIYAYTKPEVFMGARLPIAGDAGDQFAAVFGQACFEPGSMLCNLGTGASLSLNVGDRYQPPSSGLDSPVLWAINGMSTRGVASWTNVSGAAIQWLRDELGLIRDSAEAEVLASRVPDTHGIYFVPAFTGLGSPYNDPYARGSLFGITQSASRNHVVRAALEGMAYQVRDCYENMKAVASIEARDLQVGGGAAANGFLLQFIADILGVPLTRPLIYESSVLGAAFLAGLSTGYWESQDEIRALVRPDRHFEPHISAAQREELYHGWQRAVKRSIGWLKE